MDEDRRSWRLVTGLVGLVAALAAVGSGFLAWITTAMDTGGRAAISGWGSISGGSAYIDGTNVNDLMSGVTGVGSYRPALVVVIAGAVAVVPAVVLAVTGPGRRPYRTVGVVLGAAGLVILVWGVIKAVDPGDLLGILSGGIARTGFGPILAAIAGLLLAGCGGVVLGGWLDPRRAVERRTVDTDRAVVARHPAFTRRVVGRRPGGRTPRRR